VPPTVDDRLRDILEAIPKIEKLTDGTDLAGFTADELRRLATERLPEIICEASRSVPDTIKDAAPEIHWRKMIDFGNLLRHAYHATDVATVWDVVVNELPSLKAFVNGKLSESRS
jgi:uncharacterized protein with HEPN domain